MLARPAAQQAAFEQFLADQQNPASANYHHWLTAAEIGERFGPSDADVAAIKGWLQSEGAASELGGAEQDVHWFRRHGGGDCGGLPNRAAQLPASTAGI
ncbi:MAG: protease pro-enzyme activation domain-containing protein [Terracidiphilus sp.]